MDKRDNIRQMVDETLECLEGIQRAETQPFFYTRLVARMENEDSSLWSRMVLYLTRPAVTLGLLFIILILNGLILVGRLENKKDDSRYMTSDYAAAQISYYDPNAEQP